MKRWAGILALVVPVLLVTPGAKATISRGSLLDYELPTTKSWLLDKEEVFANIKAPGTFQIDVLPITTTRGTPDVTTANSEIIINRVSKVYETLSNGTIKLQLRAVLPVKEASSPVRSPMDVQTLMGKSSSEYEPAAVLVGVIVPDPSIDFSGIATLGGSVILMNTPWTTSSRTITNTFAHEFGHNLGLNHSGHAECSGETFSTCEIEEYGDGSDFMGRFIPGYVTDPPHLRLNGWHLNRLGLLPAEAVVTVAKSGIFELAPVYSGNGTRLLIIPVYNSDGYAIEYRPAIGPDSQLALTRLDIPGSRSYYNNDPSHGVQVRALQRTADAKKTMLPTSGSGPSVSVLTRKAAPIQGMLAGESISLPDGSSIRVLSADPNRGARVEVTIPADTTAPTLEDSRLQWSYSDDDEVIIYGEDWMEMVFDINATAIFEDRLVAEVILEVNGVEVARQSRLTKYLSLTYSPREYGTFKVRAIVRDLSGNQTVKERTLVSKKFQHPKSKVQLRAGKPAKSVVEVWYPDSWLTYKITSSAGVVGKPRYVAGWQRVYITNLKPGQLVSVYIIGSDEIGDDGGQTLVRKTSTK